MNKKVAAAVSHHYREVAELRAHRELAVAYLKAAMESLDDPDDRAAGLLALRTVAEAYGGLAAVAVEAGMQRVALSYLVAQGQSNAENSDGGVEGCGHEAFG